MGVVANYTQGRVLMKESTKWGKSWLNKNGEKVRIFFVNLNNQKEPTLSRYKGSVGNYLTKDDLKSEFRVEKSKKEIKEMSLEEVVAIIEKSNH